MYYISSNITHGKHSCRLSDTLWLDIGTRSGGGQHQRNGTTYVLIWMLIFVVGNLLWQQMQTNPTNCILAVATNTNKSSNSIWAHHNTHSKCAMLQYFILGCHDTVPCHQCYSVIKYTSSSSVLQWDTNLNKMTPIVCLMK
jgi:hypothetical protein